MKNAFKISFFFCLSFYFQTISHAQNIGINTIDPSARLHIKGNTSNVDALKLNFEEGTLAPGTNEGDVDWFITSTEGYLSNRSMKCPLIVNAGDDAIVEFQMSQVANKKVDIEFYYQYVDDGSVSFGVSTNEGDFFPPPTLTSWKKFSTSYISNGTENILKFRVDAIQDEAFPLILIDNILVSYEDGHSLKIEDGNQANGYILESDELGHAKWVDLRSEIDQTIDEAILDGAQQLQFDHTNSELSISEGNSVRIGGLQGSTGYKFRMDGFTLTGDPGVSIDLPSGNSSTSRFYYNSTNGQFIRGRYVSTPSLGDYATAWGWYNFATGDRSTAFGENNTASGLLSTVWGDENVASGESSTSWGKFNEAAGNKSTAFGFLNAVSGEYATAWGYDNIVSNDLATVWGLENEVTGYNATVWGLNNEVTGTSSTVWGQVNEVLGSNSTVFGNNNTSGGDKNIIGGFNNVCNSENSILIGNNLLSNYDNEIIMGQYNSGITSYWYQLFSIGVGYNDSYRRNAFTVLTNGDVGIGTSDPSVNFHVYGDSNGADLRLEAQSGTDATLQMVSDNDVDLLMAAGSRAEIKILGTDRAMLRLDSDVSSVIRFSNLNSSSKSISYYEDDNSVSLFDDIFIDNSNVGINEENPSYNLEMAFNDAAKPGSSSWTVSSDRRLKKDIVPFTDGLNVIEAIDPVWFTYNGLAGLPQETYVGTIAQELAKISPYMVGTFEYNNEDGSVTEYHDVDYGAMDFVLINAIKEQQTLITTQQEKIDALEAQLASQQAQIDAIFSQLDAGKK